MTFNNFIFALTKNKKMPLPNDYNSWVEASYSLKIHAEGARPKYSINGTSHIPEGYNPKYDKLFRTRILNRHPNENDVHYNWRLSVYSPVAKEIFTKFENLCIGSILQGNNYTIYADDVTLEYMNSIDFDFAYGMKFMLKNEYYIIAVVVDEETAPNTNVKPVIIYVSIDNVIMYDNESIAFKHNGKTYYINDTLTAVIIKDNIVSYNHNFGFAPFIFNSNTFLNPFKYWSDLLVRNMNDDEAMVKHYSYPKLQMTLPECPVCFGQKKVTEVVKDENGIDTHNVITCTNCNGEGVISRNPGDVIAVSEDTIIRGGGNMPEYARFITPDVSIPNYHLTRWQVFYEKVEKSLHLRSVNDGVQSGDAKKEDRKDQYFFLNSISHHFFNDVKKIIRFISRYLNYESTKDDVIVVPPRQFDLMSDFDLVSLLSDAQSKVDDSQIIAELNYQVSSKIYSNDSVQKKISDVLYYTDVLYGMSGQALQRKVLSGVYNEEEKIIHEKGYFILLNYSREVSTDVFVAMELDEIIKEFLLRVKEKVPNNIYS